MKRREKPTVVECNMRARSRFFTIESLLLRFSNGALREFERIASSPTPGTVTIVALTNACEVLLLREYAAGLDRYEWTLPSGSIEPGETAETAAARELSEETGYCARRIERVCQLAVAPSIFSYQTEVVLARDLYVCHAQGDEPEEAETAFCPLDDIGGPHQVPPLHDARAIAAICSTKTHLKARTHYFGKRTTKVADL